MATLEEGNRAVAAEPVPPRTAAAHDSAVSVQALLAQGRQRLADCSGQLESELLLAHRLGVSRSRLLAFAERRVEPAEANDYLEALERLARGEPLAYLCGSREFWSLPLAVGPAVLVPRPDTELAVERSLALLSEAAAPSVCDLGTGSGAIALALASERPGWRLTATDRSAAALGVARDNALRLGLTRIEWLAGDWFEPLAGRRFDLLVSNPPYIGSADPALATLRFEPREALTPGPSGLEALEAIISTAPAHLAGAGWLVLEHGATQAAPVARALVAAGFARVRCHPDLAGHDRVTEAQWP